MGERRPDKLYAVIGREYSDRLFTFRSSSGAPAPRLRFILARAELLCDLGFASSHGSINIPVRFRGASPQIFRECDETQLPSFANPRASEFTDYIDADELLVSIM